MLSPPVGRYRTRAACCAEAATVFRNANAASRFDDGCCDGLFFDRGKYGVRNTYVKHYNNDTYVIIEKLILKNCVVRLQVSRIF